MKKNVKVGIGVSMFLVIGVLSCVGIFKYTIGDTTQENNEYTNMAVNIEEELLIENPDVETEEMDLADGYTYEAGEGSTSVEETMEEESLIENPDAETEGQNLADGYTYEASGEVE